MAADHPSRRSRVKERKQPLASKVFEAALVEGMHLDFLSKEYEQLKSGEWDPHPRKSCGECLWEPLRHRVRLVLRVGICSTSPAGRLVRTGTFS
jgi:hypothetical protein